MPVRPVQKDQYTKPNMESFNVLDYGATGDGTTDDTTAVQAAYDAANTAGGGIVFFPEGTYILTPVYAYATTSTQGAGNLVTILKRKAGAVSNPTSIGVLNYHGTSGSIFYSFYVRDICVDGNKANVTGATVDTEAFSFKWSRHFTVENCRAINSSSDGFDIDECLNATFIANTSMDNGGNGFHPSDNSSQLRFVSNYAFGNGFDFSRAGFDQFSTVTNCVFVGNTSISNYQNYNITGSGAIVSGNQSLGTPTIADVWTGVKQSGTMQGVKKLSTSFTDDVFTQSGWTYVEGNGTASVTHALTFPVTYTELYSLSVTRAGNAGTTIPTSISNGAGVASASEQVGFNTATTSGANVTLQRGTGTYGTGNYFMYSWIATGKR